MQNEFIKYRWVFVVTMFLFLLYHQLVGFLIEPLAILFRDISSVRDLWFTAAFPVEVIFLVIFLLVWGFLFDRHSRRALISLAGFLWGISAWLMGLAPTLALFNVSRTFSGFDRASHSGIYAMVGDLFKPTNRGKILGLLLLAQPVAFMFGMILSDSLTDMLQWRSVFLLLGAVGFLLALMIHNFVREPKRGAMEPALIDINMTGTYQFDWDIAFTELRKQSMIVLYLFIFISSIPWVVLSEGVLVFLRELQTLQPQEIYLVFLPTFIGVSIGYPVGGLLGDLLFRIKRTGRIIISLLGVIAPSFCMYYAFVVHNIQGQGFVVGLMLMGFFMAFTWSNVFASLMDITLPELRASAFALALVFQMLGASISPFVLSLARGLFGWGGAILWTCVGACVICLFLLLRALFLIPGDIELLRRHMAYRSHLEARLQKEN